MGSFTCQCGVVTYEADEPPDASGVLYSLDELFETEARLANRLASFVALQTGPERTAWLASYFGVGYPEDLSDQEVIADIVSRELDESFTPVFRCPACRRIAAKEEGRDGWVFYIRDPETHDE